MKRSSRRRLDGVLLFDKPAGISSNGALGLCKRLFQPLKAGHTGSLDPFATGMLPICFGEATKFSQFLLDANKTYIAELSLGRATTTGDPEGDECAVAAVPDLDEEGLRATLATFLGAGEQTPPMYSALKIDGKRLYKLARQGETVAREPRPITIYDLQFLRWTERGFAYQVRCSKGTYVRVLSEDIAKALGTVGYTASLRRLAVGHFSGAMHDSQEIEALYGPGRDALLEPVDACCKTLPRLDLDRGATQALMQGQRPQSAGPDEAHMRAYCDGAFFGVVRRETGVLGAVRLIRTDG